MNQQRLRYTFFLRHTAPSALVCASRYLARLRACLCSSGDQVEPIIAIGTGGGTGRGTGERYQAGSHGACRRVLNHTPAHAAPQPRYSSWPGQADQHHGFNGTHTFVFAATMSNGAGNAEAADRREPLEMMVNSDSRLGGTVAQANHRCGVRARQRSSS